MQPSQPEAVANVELTPRQRREREYYDEYARKKGGTDVDFAPVLSEERRPWSCYWFIWGLVRDRAALAPDQTLLDIGSGAGRDCVRYAKLGYRVQGIDISPGNCELAAKLAEKYGVQDRMETRPMPAERLDFPDATFDVVTGVDVLHHVEVDKTVAEVMRVLKPGGVAFFKECVEVPVLDPLYQGMLGRLPGRRQASIERHMTADERKLNRRRDVGAMRALCPKMKIHWFQILGRFDRFLPSRLARRGPLERLDYRLTRWVPALGPLGGWCVFVLPKD
jgi:SAM-dependent methyltransferase